MIRALLKKQLLELGAVFVRSSKTGKRRSRAGAFGYALLFAVLMLLVMLSFGSMALPLAVTLVPQGLDWLYFVLMELSALTVSVLASAFTSYGHLFRCRDNQQLLALPIPPGAIFAVRCGGVYLTGLIYLLLAWVPSVVCYALAAPRPGGALLAALPVALALAGVSMVLAVLLGWAVALLNRRAQHKSLVTVVGTLLFLAVYYAVFQWVGNAVEALAVDAVQAGATAGRVAAPLHLLGMAAAGSVPALLLLLALSAACMAFCGKVLAKPYLRLLTLEPGRTKAEYRAKTQKKQSPCRALLRRELLHLGACPMWLLNCALSSLLLPVQQMSRGARRVADGEYDIEDFNFARSDEIGMLADSFNHLKHQIARTIHALESEAQLEKSLRQQESEAARLRQLIEQSRFAQLQSQINPHFLYNTLDSINWRAKALGDKDISTMVEALGALLRVTLSHKETISTIGSELEIVRNYMSIIQVRYDDRIEFRDEVPTALYEQALPQLTLQPVSYTHLTLPTKLEV